jgi:hypothetical protein
MRLQGAVWLAEPSVPLNKQPPQLWRAHAEDKKRATPNVQSPKLVHGRWYIYTLPVWKLLGPPIKPVGQDVEGSENTSKKIRRGDDDSTAACNRIA